MLEIPGYLYTGALVNTILLYNTFTRLPSRYLITGWWPLIGWNRGSVTTAYHSWLSSTKLGPSGNIFIQQGNLGEFYVPIVICTAMQSSFNQSEDSSLSINQFNTKASKYPINQVRGPWIDWLIDSNLGSLRNALTAVDPVTDFLASDYDR